MSDARWNDPREYDGRDRGDQWPRVYDPRGRDEYDPREALMRDLDLRRGDERELVVDRGRVYELAGEDSRALAAVGAFRIVPEHDLDLLHDTLDNLHDQRLVDLVDLGDTERGLTLTADGRELLDSHSLERDREPSQTFYAGVSRSREIDHDSNLYATFRQEEARLRDEHPDLEIRRVVLEQDLKREYQEFLQDHNRDRSDSDDRPGRDENEVRDWAREHELPYFDDHRSLTLPPPLDDPITRTAAFQESRGALQVRGPRRALYASQSEREQVPGDVLSRAAGARRTPRRSVRSLHRAGVPKAGHAEDPSPVSRMATSGRSGALAVVLDVSARRLVLRAVNGGGSAAEPSVPSALRLDGPRCLGQEGGQAKIASGLLEGLFADELALLQPTPGYMRLLKESVLQIWKARKTALRDEIVTAER